MDTQEHYKDYAVPITQMKEITKRGGTFKIVFRRKDGKLRIIHRAILRKQSLGDTDSRSAYKIQLLNMDSMEARSAYIPLIVSLNDKPIIL